MAKNSKASATTDKNTLAAKAPKVSGKTARQPRKLKKPQYRSFQLQRRISTGGPKLIGSFKLFRQALGVLKHHWRVFGMLILIYALLNFVIVRGFSSGSDVDSIKATLEGMFDGESVFVCCGRSLGVFWHSYIL